MSALEDSFDSIVQVDPEKTLTAQEISDAIRKIPTTKQLVISRATEIMAATLGADQEDAIKRLTRNLTNDPALTQLLRR
jgi:hypothetical protein